jgi:hypothetical protein
MKSIILIVSVFFALDGSAQIKVPKDSVKQSNKTDSIDFRSDNPKKQRYPADSIKWNARDSFQIDDKNPKRIPKPGRDTIH